MLVGEDFDKIHLYLFGLDISEPNVFISDFIMSLVSLYCGWRLMRGKKSSAFKRWWIAFFIVYGISSFGGGIGHSLYTYFTHYGKLFTWITGIFSIYLIERAMIAAISDSRLVLRYKLFSLLKLCVVYLVFLLILFFAPIHEKPGLPFLPIAINTIVGVSWFAGYIGYQMSKQKPAFRSIYYGVLIMLPSAVFFLGKINLHPWFDKNDVSHLLLSIGIVFFCLGVERVSNESVLTYSNE